MLIENGRPLSQDREAGMLLQAHPAVAPATAKRTKTIHIASFGLENDKTKDPNKFCRSYFPYISKKTHSEVMEKLDWDAMRWDCNNKEHVDAMARRLFD